MLADALAYASIGWWVFPVYGIRNGRCECPQGSSCSRPGKHPRTQHGLSDASIDPEVITGWWTRWPNSNIGIAARPSGLVIIDIDPRHGGDISYGDLREKHGYSLVDTVSADTGGGGSHFYFRKPEGVTIGDVATGEGRPGPLGAGVDVRAAGYVIAPPSRHISGEAYEWFVDSSPFDREPETLPQALVELLSGTKEKPDRLPLATVLSGVPEGERDWQIFLNASALQGAGVPIEMAYRLIEDAAAACVPPFPLDVARRKVEFVYGKYPAPELGLGAIRAPGSLFIPVGELDNLPELEWLIDGFAQVSGFGVLVAPYASYKTFVLLDMALCVGAGRHWHGREVRQGAVLYAFGEGLRGLKGRVRAWEESNRVPARNVYFLPRAIQMLQKEDVEYVLSHIRTEIAEPPRLIILDTLARSMSGGDENQQRDMGLLIEGVDRLIRETGASVWVAHHTNKSGEYRGSTALPGAADTMARVAKKPGNSITISCEKLKDAEPFEDIELLAMPYGQSLAIETPSTWAMTRIRQEALREEAKGVLDALRSLGERGARFGDWLAATGLPRTTFNRYRGELLDAEIVRQEGDFYRVSETVSASEQLGG